MKSGQELSYLLEQAPVVVREAEAKKQMKKEDLLSENTESHSGGGLKESYRDDRIHSLGKKKKKCP